MIDKAWYKLMGLTEAAFNKNFYVAVVLVLLVTNGTALWFWEQSIRRVENNLKERVVIIQIIEKEKHLIQEKCDSLRYLDLRYF